MSNINENNINNTDDSQSSLPILIAATAVVIFLWFIPFGNILTLPIRYFVTIMHEVMHALAFEITRGDTNTISIFANGSGVTRGAGGNDFIVLSAGYVGTTLMGCILLFIGSKTKKINIVFYCLSVMTIIAGLMWVRPIFGFGFLISLVVSALLFSAGMFLKGKLSRFALQFLALQFCLSSLWDLAVLLRLNAGGSSSNDAAFLYQATGIPAILWSILWGFISIGLVLVTLSMMKLNTKPAVKDDTVFDVSYIDKSGEK